jgi:hypothetical protein
VTIVCEFNASLKGAGLIWYRCNIDGFESPVGYGLLNLRVLGFDKSGFQNVAELLGVKFLPVGSSVCERLARQWPYEEIVC